MRSFLEGLEINQKVQSFFKPYLTQTCDDVIFDQDNYFEHASNDFHRVPITEAIWQAGDPDLASHAFICGSAIDAISWLHFNQFRFRHLDQLLFISTGAVPNTSLTLSPGNAVPFQQHTPKKIHLIYSNDLLGAICDIKTASYIRKLPIKITAEKGYFELNFKSKTYVIENLSIHALEKAAGFHFNIRTHKPKKHTTFYEQLKNGHRT